MKNWKDCLRPAALLALALAFAGCAPSTPTTPKGDVVEVETIEVTTEGTAASPKPAEPAGPVASADEIIAQAAKQAAEDAKKEEAAKLAEEAARKEAEAAKLAADRARQQADREIEEAAKAITESKTPAAPTPPAKPPAAEPAAPAKEPVAPTATKEPAVPAAEPAKTDGAAAKAAPAAGRAGREQVMLGDPSLTAGVPGSGPITLEQIDAWLADAKNVVEIEPLLPLGLSQGAAQITGLDKNPLSRAKIELGRQLYFDPRLSVDSTVSCASCHSPAEGYSARTKTGVGIRGQLGGRNSPVSFNRILSGPQFWDGRVDSLEAQAVGPIQNPIEMGFTHEGVVKRLGEMPVYKRQFEKIFGELTIDRVGEAIAAFERVLVTAPSPYDYGEQIRSFAGLDEEDIAEDAELAKRYAEAKKAAEANPMSDSAKRGREIFFTEKGNCTACHVGANLADEKYHNIGIGMDRPEPDLGRFVVTKDEKDRGAFKTPTVRNVALSAPYMHDGSVATLEEVVEWYDKGGHPNPHLSDKMRPLKLTAEEKADLVAFMKACTGPTPTVETSRLPADN
jgi:cytochrome c peroxidase